MAEKLSVPSNITKGKVRIGAILTGTVVDVRPEYVVINAGLKSESTIRIEQFRNDAGDVEVTVGDEVQAALDPVEDGFGETRLSREKAKHAQAWTKLEKAYEDSETITGVISGKVKGGFTVDIDDIRAFLPGSLVDVRPVRDTSFLEGKPLKFKVIKLDRRRNNVVVSRRAVVEGESYAEREVLLESLQEGAVIKGVVKNLTDHGAFVDLGGIDGLLHITDMTYKRIKHPMEVVNVGDEIDVKVLKFDRERNRVSLGLKQHRADPWVGIAQRYPEGSRIKGKVTVIADYGCFAEIEEGIEGLVHVSEMDWTDKNIHPSNVVRIGDEVDVMVLDIDEGRRRISLGLKQAHANPWEEFAALKNNGDHVLGVVKSITDFGIFVGLDGGIEGLVHLSDISWNESGEDVIRSFKKGDEIETVVLSIDAVRERISLGIKQLDKYPFAASQDESSGSTPMERIRMATDWPTLPMPVRETLTAAFHSLSAHALDPLDQLEWAQRIGQATDISVEVHDAVNRLIFIYADAAATKQLREEALGALQLLEKLVEHSGPRNLRPLIALQIADYSRDFGLADQAESFYLGALQEAADLGNRVVLRHALTGLRIQHNDLIAPYAGTLGL